MSASPPKPLQRLSFTEERQRDANVRACLKEVMDSINSIEDVVLHTQIRERVENLEVTIVPHTLSWRLYVAYMVTECLFDNDDWAKHSPEDRVLRVAILGRSNCGQQQLINKFLCGSVDGDVRGHKNVMQLVSGLKRPTVSMGRKHKTVVPCNGQDRTLLLRTSSANPSPQVLWWADAFLICFDVHNEDSLTTLRETHSKAMQFRHANGLPFIAVGIDGLHDGDQKAVSEDLEQLCSELSGVSFLPVNPYTGHNVHRLFHDVVHDIVEFVLPSPSTEKRVRVGQLDNIKRSADPTLPGELGSGRSIPVIQGILRKRPHAPGKPASKRWATLTEGQFTYYPSLNEYMGNAPGKHIDLFGTTVKVPRTKKGSSNKSANRQFTIVSMNSSDWTFEAKDEHECAQWVAAIEKEIEGCLTRATSAGAKNVVSSNNGGAKFSVLTEEEIKKIKAVPGNGFCADCGAEDPAWASLNLAVLTCIECSGIHRALGVHISRMRSLALDDWKPDHVDLLTCIGNKLANTVWEAEVPPNREKPGPTASRSEKEVWVKAKYKDRQFVTKRDEPEKVLYGNLAKNVKATAETLSALALCSRKQLQFSGVDGRTVLHLVSASGDAMWAQLLIWEGADVNAQDVHGRTPLYYARSRKHSEVSSLLTAAGCTGTGAGSLQSVMQSVPSDSILHTPEKGLPASNYSTPIQDPEEMAQFKLMEQETDDNTSFSWFDDSPAVLRVKREEHERQLEERKNSQPDAVVQPDVLPELPPTRARTNTVFEKPKRNSAPVSTPESQPARPRTPASGSRTLPAVPKSGGKIDRTDSRGLMTVGGKARPEEYSPTPQRKVKRSRAKTVSTIEGQVPNSFV